MNCRLTDLRRKEVISAVDGSRIGFVDDVLVDTSNAKIVAFVIFGGFFLFGIIGKRDDFIIPWEKIQLIGEDAVIVNCKLPQGEKSARKRLIFWKK